MTTTPCKRTGPPPPTPEQKARAAAAVKLIVDYLHWILPIIEERVARGETDADRFTMPVQLNESSTDTDKDTSNDHDDTT